MKEEIFSMHTEVIPYPYYPQSRKAITPHKSPLCSLLSKDEPYLHGSQPRAVAV